MSVRDRIRDEVVGATGKRVLLVEGTDDRAALEVLLGRFSPSWERHWGIAEAGKKQQVIGLLRQEPDWLGVVDRDEWDDATIANYATSHPNLVVLPRFCLESYLIVPSELWAAFPEVQKRKVTGGETALRDAILAEIPLYLRHGALWKVITPLWSSLRALGFKEALASETSLGVAQDDAEIQRILGDWDALLNPTQIFTNFQAALAAAQAATPSEQLTQWIHGKVFWSRAVHPALNQLLVQASEKDYRNNLFRNVPLPADLQPLFDRIVPPPGGG